jgi:hypothetical protein
MSNLTAAYNILNTLTVSEMLELNKALCAKIRLKRQSEAVVKISKFNVGQVVTFFKPGRGRNAGTHYIKISGYNRAGTAIVGKSCTRDGVIHPFPLKWTVAVSTESLKLVG